jgi:hypothetical protein
MAEPMETATPGVTCYNCESSSVSLHKSLQVRTEVLWNFLFGGNSSSPPWISSFLTSPSCFIPQGSFHVLLDTGVAACAVVSHPYSSTCQSQSFLQLSQRRLKTEAKRDDVCFLLALFLTQTCFIECARSQFCLSLTCFYLSNCSSVLHMLASLRKLLII